MLANSWLMGAIMVVAGFGIPVMASLNSGLGARLANPVLATAILFALALALTIAVLIVQGTPLVVHVVQTPLKFYLGGFLVAFYVPSITWIAPKIGVGNAIFLVLLGQLIASALVDHYGWFGVPQSSLTLYRCFGIALMVIGLLLAGKPIGGIDATTEPSPTPNSAEGNSLQTFTQK